MNRSFFKHGQFFLIAALAFIVLGGCQSLQRDVRYSSADAEFGGELAYLEDIIVALEKNASRSALTTAWERIRTLEAMLVKDALFEARLAAWSGRLYLLEGNLKEAEREQKKSEQLNAGNVYAAVLLIRLESNPEKALGRVIKSMETYDSETIPGEFYLEQGRFLFALSNFREAVAAFDKAFSQLRPVYRAAYQEDRDLAWESRDLQSSVSRKITEIMAKPFLSWEDVIEITKSETDIFRFLTAGRDWSVGDIFKSLVDRLIIPQTQEIRADVLSIRRPALNDLVLRSGASWYLWHLLAEVVSDKTLLVRYSSRYNQRNSRSPIPDLPLDSPFFDSVLGCVEWEIMALPDGKNFLPDGMIRGPDLLRMLTKVTPR